MRLLTHVTLLDEMKCLFVSYFWLKPGFRKIPIVPTKEQRTTDCRQLVMHFSSKDWGKHCTTVCKIGNSHDVRDCRQLLRQVFLPKILLQLLRKVLSGNWSGFYTSMPSKHCLLPRLGWGRGHKGKCWSSQSASPLKWCYVTTCLFCSHWIYPLW